MGTSSRSRTACSRRPVRPAAAAVSIRDSVWQRTPSDARVTLFSVLTTDQKGTIAEMAIVLECAKAGIGVSRPLDDERYDSVLDLRPQLVRIQCKWAVLYGDVIVVRLYSNRRSRDGMITRRYDPADIDGFGAYCAATGRCYLLDAGFAAYRQVQLRVNPTRNNQAQLIRRARDFEFSATLLGRLGAVAQLGERLAGSQKVRGSSPLGSIAKPP